MRILFVIFEVYVVILFKLLYDKLLLIVFITTIKNKNT